MNNFLESSQYKNLHRLLMLAEKDGEGLVAQREEIDGAVDALLLLAERQQYTGGMGILTDEIAALFDVEGPIRHEDLRTSMLRYIRQLRLEPDQSTVDIPASSTTTSIPLHNPIVDDISNRAGGLSLEPKQSGGNGLPEAEVAGVTMEADVRKPGESQPTAGKSGVEHRRDKATDVEKPGEALKDPASEQPKQREKGATNDVAMKTADRSKRDRDDSGESEQTEEDQEVPRTRSRKKRRISSRPMVADSDEESTAPTKVQKKSRSKSRKPTHANSDDDVPKFPTGRASRFCVSCKKLGIECRIYVGRPKGRRRVACVKCNKVRKQCSFILHGKPHVVGGTKTGEKDNDSGEDFGSEDEETDDEMDDEDIEEKGDKSHKAGAEGKGKAKAKQTDDPKGKKGKGKSRTPSSYRAQSRARSATGLRVKFEDQDEDLEWVHTPNVGTSSGMIRRPRSDAHETAEIWAELREMQGNTQEFRREIRGDMSQIRSNIDRLTIDHDTATKFLTDKIILVEKGLQSQIDCLQEQTLKISSAMSTVVEQVSNLPKDLRNVMDTWGTIRFGPLRGTPTTVSGKDLECSVDEWMNKTASFLEAKPEPLSQVENLVAKHEERSPSPTSSAYKEFVNFLSSQPKPDDDAPMRVDDSDNHPNLSVAAADDGDLDTKMTIDSAVYDMAPLQLSNPAGSDITIRNRDTDGIPTCPVLNVIGPTPTGSLQSVSMSTEVIQKDSAPMEVLQSTGINANASADTPIPIPTAIAPIIDEEPSNMRMPPPTQAEAAERDTGLSSNRASDPTLSVPPANNQITEDATDLPNSPSPLFTDPGQQRDGPPTAASGTPPILPSRTDFHMSNIDTNISEVIPSTQSTIGTIITHDLGAPSPIESPIEPAPIATPALHSPIESSSFDLPVHSSTSVRQMSQIDSFGSEDTMTQNIANESGSAGREVQPGPAVEYPVGIRDDIPDIAAAVDVPDNSGLQVPPLLEVPQRTTRQRSASPVPPLGVVTRSRSGSRSIQPPQDRRVDQPSRASNVRRGRKPGSKRS